MSTICKLTLVAGWAASLVYDAEALPAQESLLFSDAGCGTQLSSTLNFGAWSLDTPTGAVDFGECISEDTGGASLNVCRIDTGEAGFETFSNQECTGDPIFSLVSSGTCTAGGAGSTCSTSEQLSCSQKCVDADPTARPSSFEEFYVVGDQYTDEGCVTPTGKTGVEIPSQEGNVTLVGENGCFAVDTDSYYGFSTCNADGSISSWVYAKTDTTCSETPISQSTTVHSSAPPGYLCLMAPDGYYYQSTGCEIGELNIITDPSPMPINDDLATSSPTSSLISVSSSVGVFGGLVSTVTVFATGAVTMLAWRFAM